MKISTQIFFYSTIPMQTKKVCRYINMKETVISKFFSKGVLFSYGLSLGDSLSYAEIKDLCWGISNFKSGD